MEDREKTSIKVSVVIPLYNKERYISQTLEDFFIQRFKEIEIIVVDDHSTDNSLSVVKETLSDCPFSSQIICSDLNLGVSGARNLGIPRCRGDFIFFFDADDRIDRNCIEFLYEEAIASEADLVFSGVAVEGASRKHAGKYVPPVKMKKPDVRQLILMDYLKGRRWLNASNVLYRKSLIENYNLYFPAGCKFAEDREFILKAIFHSVNISFVDKVLCTYIQHPGQTTKQLSTDVSKYAHAVGVYKRLLNYFQQVDVEPFIIDLINQFEIPNSLIKMACSYAENGERGLFEKFVSLPAFRTKLYPSWKTLFYKPEVAFKVFIVLFFPSVLYNRYSKRHK